MSIYHLIVYDCGQEFSMESRASNKREATYTHFHILRRPWSLPIMEISKHRRPVKQLSRRPKLYQLPLMQNCHHVRVRDGVQPMCDCNDSMLRELLADDELHER